ncbi:MAG: hypothetical protein Q4A79_00720 [Candidatus Saccharibacteria bacterium]|nr:hypothetical protein [Candidatus Saccharibacteria bacterium]
MDKNQMPSVQPIDNTNMAGMNPGGNYGMPETPIAMPNWQQTNAGSGSGIPTNGGTFHDKSLIFTIATVLLGLVSVTFIGLFIWMTIQYNGAREDISGQISIAVAKAVDEKTMELEDEFAEREKEPYRDFAGPADYGQLSFRYPKTWSVYIAANARNGGDFKAYFNPIEVDTVSDTTINALRVTIRDKDFESVVAEYQRAMDRKDSGLSVTSVTVGGTIANRYTGKIPGTDLNGVIVIFKIRDKTAILQTDAMVFLNDFDLLLSTVTFNA